MVQPQRFLVLKEITVALGLETVDGRHSQRRGLVSLHACEGMWARRPWLKRGLV